ncbi:MAG: hypothetical protein ACLFWF_09065 [Alphaproteobacteria bacterium]
MKRFHSTNRATGRIPVVLALGAGTALLLSACSSDPGEEVVDAPFPELVDVPSRPKAGTTPEERAALKTQLEERRDEINRAAASLLRGGTEPVPVSLDSQVPSAPSGAATPPPPLPGGLPESPERPAAGAGGGIAGQDPDSSGPKPRGEAVIKAPDVADMPPSRAAGETEKEKSSEDASEEDPPEESEENPPEEDADG